MTQLHLEIQLDFAFYDLLVAARKHLKGKAIILEKDFALYDAVCRVELLAEALAHVQQPDDEEEETDDLLSPITQECGDAPPAPSGGRPSLQDAARPTPHDPPRSEETG